MKIKTLRERQRQKAARAERRLERQREKEARHNWDSGYEPEEGDIADGEADNAESEAAAEPQPQKTLEQVEEHLKLDETIAAMENIAEKFGLQPEVAEPSAEDEENTAAENDAEQSAEDNIVELSAFDHFRKSRQKDGYQSRDNGKLFKYNNLSLILRFVIFVILLVVAITKHDALVAAVYARPWIGFNWLLVLWIVALLAVLSRFVPGLVKNPGCQKQFMRNFVPAPNFDEANMQIKKTIKHANRGAWKVAGVWVLLNAVFAALYISGVVDEAFMILLSVVYSVGDVICVLYYCPFRHLLMKNRCCMTCRIYNWDYLMMFTPLIFIKSWFTWSLVAVALILFIRWEYVYNRHPEWFFGATNSRLRCVNCDSKLCRAKYPATPTAKKLFDREK